MGKQLRLDVEEPFCIVARALDGRIVDVIPVDDAWPSGGLNGAILWALVAIERDKKERG